MKDVVLVVSQKNLLPLSSREALTIPKGQLILHCFSEGKIKFFIYCSYMCLPLNIQNWGFYLTVISVSNFMRLMTCRTKLCLQFCVYFCVNIWYVTCTILIKTWLSLYLIWGFNFMLQNALKISMKSIMKIYRFVCQFITRNPHICHIYFYKNLLYLPSWLNSI